jgi:hypothetical protein
LLGRAFQSFAQTLSTVCHLSRECEESLPELAARSVEIALAVGQTSLEGAAAAEESELGEGAESWPLGSGGTKRLALGDKVRVVSDEEAEHFGTGRELARIDASQPAASAEAQKAIAMVAGELVLPKDVTWRMTLAVSEAAQLFPGGLAGATLSLVENGESVLVVVRSSGPGALLEQLRPAPARSGDKPGEFGLEVIRRAVDQMIVGVSGSVVILDFHLEG